MEENLNLQELQAILDASRKVRKEQQRFAAALKGVKLDDDEGEGPTGDDVRRKAEAEMRGMSEEAYELGEIGIAVLEE